MNERETEKKKLTEVLFYKLLGSQVTTVFITLIV